MNIQLKSQATLLRKRGYLYSEIAESLGVSKSTAHLWTHDTRLTDKQTQKIFVRYSESRHNSIAKMALANRVRREKRDLEIEAQAKAVVQNVRLSTDQKKLLCASLFWCEGGKNVSGGIQFINSDPAMMRVFLKLLRESFALDERKFRALMHLHEYHDQETQLKYWSNLTQIPSTQFHKSYLKAHTGKNQREDYQGCVSVRYLDSSLGKLLKMIYIEFSKSI